MITISETKIDPEANCLIFSRLLSASPEVVWKAWTEADLLKAWWGPMGFTVPLCELDAQVGGKYFYCMRGPMPDGEILEVYATGRYLEVVPGKKLAFTDSFADEKGNVVPGTHYGMEGMPLEMLVEVNLEAEGGKTRMIIRHIGLPMDTVEMTSSGWNQSFDKLAICLLGAPK